MRNYPENSLIFSETSIIDAQFKIQSIDMHYEYVIIKLDLCSFEYTIQCTFL